MSSLTLPYCEPCAKWLFAGRQFCAVHPDQPLTSRRLSGDGTVYSFTVNHVAMRPDVADRLPYTVVLVQTDEGPRILAHAEPGTRPRIGDRVRIIEADDATGLPGTGRRIARVVAPEGDRP